jgi:hypothetical protein
MAVPNITHYAAGGSGGTNVTSQAVTITQTSAPVGSLILIFVTADGNPTITADAASTTAGWQKFDQWPSTTNCTLALFWFEVVIANTVPGLTLNLSVSEATYFFQETLTAVTANQRVVLNNVKAQITAAVGTATVNPDPPAVANAVTTRDIRWLAAFAGDNGTIASTAPPSGYTILAQTSAGNAANGVALGVAHRSAAAFPVSSENPGAFTRAAEDWVAITIGAIETDFKGGTMKVWNGSAWVARPVKVWTGSAWAIKPVKFWNGSAWVLS